MARIKLTNKVVDELHTDVPGGQRYHDTELTGFGVTVYSSGKRTFWIAYGQRTRRRRMKIGVWGPLTVEKARDLARKHLATVYQGGDPLQERQDRAKVRTLGKWIDDYLADVERRKKHPRADKRYLGDARKRWGHRPIDSLMVDEVRQAFADMSDGHSIRGNRWLASVRACLNAAWRADLIPSNPASRVRPNRENTPRSRVLSAEELSQVVEAIDSWPDPFVRSALLLLILTGARGSEVLRARWSDVDLDGATWRIPSPKSGRPQIMPLHDEAVELLRTWPRRGPWLVPGRDPEQHRADLDKPWKKIRDQAKVPDVHIHDLRRTFGLQVARTAGLHVASKLLRHSTVTVTEQVYAPLGLDDLRAGLDKAAEARGKVIPLRRASGDAT